MAKNSKDKAYELFQDEEEELDFGLIKFLKNKEYDLAYEIKESEGQNFICICDIDYNDDFDTLTIPKTIDGLPVREIGAFAFSECPFKNAVLPEGLEIIHNDAFAECENLEKINIPGTVQTIESGAFEYCHNLVQVNFNEGLQKIEGSAFHETKLSHINFPDSLTFIGHWSFQRTQLNSVKFGKGLKSIEYCAFDGCESLEKVTFEEGLEFIGEYAFKANSLLKTVKLPDSLITLGYGAFDNCSALESIYLGKNLAEINFSEEGETDVYSDFLYDCPKLEKIEVFPHNKFFKVIDGLLYDAEKKILIKIPTAINKNTITIPKWVEKISSHCLLDKNLKRINIKSPSIEGMRASGINAGTVKTISCIPDSNIESFAKKGRINITPLSTAINDFLDNIVNTEKEH